MTDTLYSIVKLIETVSLTNPQVKSFAVGEDIDLAAANFNNDPVFVWLEQPIRSNFTPHTATVRLDLSMQVLDQVISDGVDLLQIQSKCDMVAQWIMDSLSFNYQERIGFVVPDGGYSHSGVTLSHHSGQKWAGIRYDFSITYLRAMSPCETIEE